MHAARIAPQNHRGRHAVIEGRAFSTWKSSDWSFSPQRTNDFQIPILLRFTLLSAANFICEEKSDSSHCLDC